MSVEVALVCSLVPNVNTFATCEFNCIVSETAWRRDEVAVELLESTVQGKIN